MQKLQNSSHENCISSAAEYTLHFDLYFIQILFSSQSMSDF